MDFVRNLLDFEFFFTMCVFVSEYVNTLACLANSMSNAYCNNNYKNDLYQINFYNVFVNAFQTNHNVGTITTSNIVKMTLGAFFKLYDLLP